MGKIKSTRLCVRLVRHVSCLGFTARKTRLPFFGPATFTFIIRSVLVLFRGLGKNQDI